MTRLNDASPLKQLLNTLPQVGQVSWIGIRPKREAPMISLDQVQINLSGGLEGDRFKGRPTSKRHVTLIQAEHLAAIGAYLHRDAIPPELLRRNIVVAGLNLLALKDQTFRVGDAILQFTGACHPCSKMERALGAGGYNAMRGHGGITARVLQAGLVTVGDKVAFDAQ